MLSSGICRPLNCQAAMCTATRAMVTLTPLVSQQHLHASCERLGRYRRSSVEQARGLGGYICIGVWPQIGAPDSLQAATIPVPHHKNSHAHAKQDRLKSSRSRISLSMLPYAQDLACCMQVRKATSGRSTSSSTTGN